MPYKILIAVEGSEGDNRPPLAVGTVLVRMGHSVTACVPPDYVDYYEERGIKAFPMGLHTREFFTANAGSMYDRNIGSFVSMYRLYRDSLRRQFNALLSHAAGADAILSSGFIFAAGTVAEKFRIPMIHTVHAPVYFPSKQVPPPNVRFTHLPTPVNSLLWLAFEASLNMLSLKELNRHRQQLGLPQLKSIREYLMKHMVMAMDPEIAPFPPDCIKQGYVQTGYPQPEPDGHISQETEEFINAGSPPVYIGFGSMLDPDAGRILRIVRDAVNRAGCRAIVYTGWVGTENHMQSGNNILYISRAPHALLFPRMAAVVHHGGAGTVHSAALAGVPQIGVPHLLDQYYLTDRIYRLGLGPAPVPRKSLTVRRLTAALSQAIHESRYRENAHNTSILLHRQDGRQEIADMILERINAGHGVV